MTKTGLFQEEYKKLNIAQKDAVDTIDGPVMVVAGPGTGKRYCMNSVCFKDLNDK